MRAQGALVEIVGGVWRHASVEQHLRGLLVAREVRPTVGDYRGRIQGSVRRLDANAATVLLQCALATPISPTLTKATCGKRSCTPRIIESMAALPPASSRRLEKSYAERSETPHRTRRFTAPWICPGIPHNMNYERGNPTEAYAGKRGLRHV